MNLVMFFLMLFAYADQSSTSMKQTQDLLRDKQAREKALKEMPDSAKKADQNVDEVVAGDADLKEEMYGVSADIFKNFEGKSAEEMQNILKQAQENPEHFYNSLSPEQKVKTKRISDRLEKKSVKP